MLQGMVSGQFCGQDDFVTVCPPGLYPIQIRSSGNLHFAGVDEGNLPQLQGDVHGIDDLLVGQHGPSPRPAARPQDR